MNDSSSDMCKEINTNSVTKYHDKSKVFIIMCETLHFEGYILLFTAAVSRNKINNNKTIIQFNFLQWKEASFDASSIVSNTRYVLSRGLSVS